MSDTLERERKPDKTDREPDEKAAQRNRGGRNSEARHEGSVR